MNNESEIGSRFSDFFFLNNFIKEGNNSNKDEASRKPPMVIICVLRNVAKKFAVVFSPKKLFGGVCELGFGKYLLI